MRTGLKWALLGALALTTLGTAPVGASHREGGDRCDGYRYRSSYGRDTIDLLVFGLTFNQRLVCFESDDPRNADKVGRIDDLVGDGRLVGIDFRNANAKLYSLGDQGGIYIIDTDDASTDKVSQLTIPPDGRLAA